MNTYKATDSIKFGWETFKKRPEIFILMEFVIFIASICTAIPIIGIIIGFFISIGLGAFMLRAHNDIQTVSISDLWHPEYIIYFAFASILTQLGIAIGIILLIVPGIIFAIMTSFTSYIVIERGLNPIAAIKESIRITKGYRSELFMLLILSAGVIIVGVLALVVGLIIAMPVVLLASVHAYKTLSHETPIVVVPTPAAEIKIVTA